VPKPDIVITSYEAAAADAPALKAIAWEVVLLDERQRGRAGLAKVQLFTCASVVVLLTSILHMSCLICSQQHAAASVLGTCAAAVRIQHGRPLS
jgi:hypothetical protein